jgi:hypothetical protein
MMARGAQPREAFMLHCGQKHGGTGRAAFGLATITPTNQAMGKALLNTAAVALLAALIVMSFASYPSRPAPKCPATGNGCWSVARTRHTNDRSSSASTRFRFSESQRADAAADLGNGSLVVEPDRTTALPVC